MMSSNTRGGQPYENAMCLSIEFLGIEKALQLINEAILLLQSLPEDEAVVIWDGEVDITVKDAIIHLKIRKDRMESIKKLRKGFFLT